MIFLIIFLFVSYFILVSIKNNKMTDRIGQLAFSSFRFLFCCLAVFSGVVPLWASDGPDDDMKETEEEACGPLQIKSQTEFVLRIIISREEVNRTRKTIEKEKI